ncbi:MAG TPA: sodium:solute symporter family protein [Anaerovoracaceae bacterium]|nr:sodium:solute symporter family protein [Anaerovoracaceae bacterium]
MDTNIVVKIHALDWLVIAIYVVAILYVGYYFHKRSKGFDDYFMAGRDLNAPLLVGTLVSTFYGLDTLFGDSEVGFFEGISAFFAYALPYTLLYAVMAFMSPVFRDKFPDGTTMQEITFKKYGQTAGIISSISSFVYSTNTMEMMGIGFLLRLITGMPFWVGVIIGAIFVTGFTWMGGLWAVTITDFIQFVVMLMTAGLALIIGWNMMGGYENIFVGLQNFVGHEDAEYYFTIGAGYLTPWTLFAYSLTAFAVLAEPAFFQRIFASSGPNEIRKGFAAGIPMWLAYDWIVAFIGIMGAAAIGLAIIPEDIAPNEALFAIAGQYLPVGVLGLFIAGVFSAAMSTADSYFLVAGGVIGFHIYKRVINPDADQNQTEQMTKIGVLIYAAFSLTLAFFFDRIMEVWVFQATVIITTCIIPVYFGTFSKKPPKKIAGTVATTFGFFASIIWYVWTNFFGTYIEDMDIYVIKFGEVELWQEYGIIIITPIVFILYMIFNALGKETMETEGVE